MEGKTRTQSVNDMKIKKKYVTPEMQVVSMDTAPLLAGSGTVSAGGEKGTWSGLKTVNTDEED